MRGMISGSALAAIFFFSQAGPAHAQTAYARSAPAYSFADESPLSINRSYLGYSNFVYRGPNPPAPGYLVPTRGPLPRGGYASAPMRRPRWFGRRQNFRY